MRECELCGFFIKSALTKHTKGKGHLRRQCFEQLESEWEKLQKLHDEPESVEFCQVPSLERINTILLQNMPGGILENILLFDLSPKSWPTTRNDCPDEFRKQGHEDETRKKIVGILDQLEAGFVQHFPELRSTMTQLEYQVLIIHAHEHIGRRCQLAPAVTPYFLPSDPLTPAEGGCDGTRKFDACQRGRGKGGTD
jgi:hypothetical protein